jgi:YesN/AraC family two-component response regulator
VLIIEDEPVQAQALARIVGTFEPGTVIQHAEDGLAAGLFLGTTLPDVVFVDVEMPKLDGVEFIRRGRRVKALDSTLFVVVSGGLTPERIAALRELKIEHVLQKPVKSNVVKEILAGHRANRHQARRLKAMP